MANEFEGVDENIVNAFKEILEQRDVLNRALEFKNKQIDDLENNKNKSDIYPVYSRSGFVSEVKKKQKFCKENDIKACVFLIRLENYNFIRETVNIICAETTLCDLAVQLKEVSKENDILGYMFEWTFAFFVPFMSEEEGKVFGANLSSKINSSAHLFQKKNVPIKTQIVHKELELDRDILEQLYNLDAIF